jgi:hypothetical protein
VATWRTRGVDGIWPVTATERRRRISLGGATPRSARPRAYPSTRLPTAATGLYRRSSAERMDLGGA